MADKLDKKRGQILRNRPLKDLLHPQLPGEKEYFEDMTIERAMLFLGGPPPPVEGVPDSYAEIAFYRKAEALDFDLVLDRLRKFEQERPQWLAEEKLGDRARYDGFFRALREGLESVEYGLKEVAISDPATSDLLIEVLRLGMIVEAVNGRYAEHRLCASIAESAKNASANRPWIGPLKAWLKGRVIDHAVKPHGKSYVMAEGNLAFCEALVQSAMVYRLENTSSKWTTEEGAFRWLRKELPHVIKSSEIENGKIIR